MHQLRNIRLFDTLELETEACLNTAGGFSFNTIAFLSIAAFAMPILINLAQLEIHANQHYAQEKIRLERDFNQNFHFNCQHLQHHARGEEPLLDKVWSALSNAMGRTYNIEKCEHKSCKYIETYTKDLADSRKANLWKDIGDYQENQAMGEELAAFRIYYMKKEGLLLKLSHIKEEFIQGNMPAYIQKAMLPAGISGLTTFIILGTYQVIQSKTSHKAEKFTLGDAILMSLIAASIPIAVNMFRLEVHAIQRAERERLNFEEKHKEIFSNACEVLQATKNLSDLPTLAVNTLRSFFFLPPINNEHAEAALPFQFEYANALGEQRKNSFWKEINDYDESKPLGPELKAFHSFMMEELGSGQEFTKAKSEFINGNWPIYKDEALYMAKVIGLPTVLITLGLVYKN